MMVLAFKKENVFKLVDILFYLSISLVSVLFKNQIVVGSIINFILFISTYRLGMKYSIYVAVLPSLIALATGTLPIFLAPILPFIIISNIVLITLFSYLKNKNLQFAVVISSIGKSLFLFTFSLIMFRLFLHESSTYLFTTFGLLQLITVSIGGGSFYIFSRFLREKK